MTPESHANNSLRHLLGWLGLGLVLLTIYLLTASQQYDADVLGELRAINRLDVSSPDPAHMLYVRLGVPVYRLWRALGYQGDALAPMQVINAFFGAGAIMMFALALRRYRVRWPLLLIVSAAAALSYAFWTHTVDAFFIIPAAFFALTALACAVYLSSARSLGRRGILIVLLGISLGLAALCYQTNLALVPALLVASWPGSRKQAVTYVKSWIVIGAVFAVVAGSAWLWQAVTLAGVREFPDLIRWFFTGHGGMNEGLWRREGVNLLVTLPNAWLATILPVYEGLGLRALSRGVLSPDRVPAQVALVMFALVLAVTAFKVLRRPSLLHNRAYLVAALWFFLPGLTVAWFDPAEVKLWLIPLFGFWLALALAWSSVNATTNRRRFMTLLMGMLALLIAVGNFLAPIWPNHRTPSRNLAEARQSAQYLQPADLIISASFDWTGYLNYISDEFRVFNAIAVAQSSGRGAVKSRLEDALSATWQQGGRTYVVDYFRPDQHPIWTEWVTPFTWLTPEDFASYERTVAWRTHGGETIWELRPRR